MPAPNPEQQRATFLRIERYCNTPLTYPPGFEPAWYKDLSQDERESIDYRMELIRAVNYKRSQGFSLEDLGNNSHLNGLTKTETAQLYSIPGVRQALEIYAGLTFRHDTRPVITGRDRQGGNTVTDITIFECKDRAQLEQIRGQIVRQVSQELHITDTHRIALPDGRRSVHPVALESEQIAFNLMCASNAFEGGDDMNTCMLSDLINIPIRNACHPLQAALQPAINKSFMEYKELGVYGKWVRQNTAGIRKRGIKYADIEQLVTVPPQSGRLWQTSRGRRGGVILFVPEFYPRTLIASLWQDLKIGNKPFSDYLLNREEVPWDLGEAAALWTQYTNRLKQAGVVWDYLQGKKPINVGRVGESISLWAAEINGPLATLAQAGNIELKQWIILASLGGPNPTNKKPRTLNLSQSQKRIIRDGTSFVARFLPSSQVFFPGDQPHSVLVPF